MVIVQKRTGMIVDQKERREPPRDDDVGHVEIAGDQREFFRDPSPVGSGFYAVKCLDPAWGRGTRGVGMTSVDDWTHYQ